MRGANRAAALSALLIAVAACSGSGSDTQVPFGDGRLLVHDESGSVYSMDPDGSDRIEIAPPDAPGRNRQPTWSPNGDRVAWVGFEGSPSLHVSSADGVDDIDAPMPTPPFYLAWSPDGTHLLTLGPAVAGSGIDVHVVDVAAGDLSPRPVDTGAPYYSAWAPDSAELLVRVGADRLGVLSADGDLSTLGPDPGIFQAPQWEGSRRVYAVEGDAKQTLIVEDLAVPRSSEVMTFDGQIFFDLAGDRLAYQVLGPDPGVQALAAAQRGPALAFVNVLGVIDLETGEHVVVHPDQVLSFFWSPDGRRLLFLTLERNTRLSWHVWDGLSVIDFPAYRPTKLFVRDYMPFFDQYARSSTVWSPDSGSFAFTGALSDGTVGVFVQEAQQGSEPVKVGDGDQVSWSP